MQLIIIKSGEDYIRVKNECFYRVNLDKASVFPVEQLELVQVYQKKLIREGFKTVSLKKLMISEEDFER